MKRPLISLIFLLFSVTLFYAQGEEGHEKYIGGKTTIDNTPPVINILSHTNNETVYKSKINIMGDFIEPHLSKIEMMSISTQYNGIAKIKKRQDKFVVTNVLIINGTNKIIINAFDKAGNITINTLQLYGLKRLSVVIYVTQDNEITFSDINISIPAGSAPCDNELVIEILKDEIMPPNIWQMSEIYSVSPAEDVPEYCFASNILVTIKYDEEKLPSGMKE